MRPGFALGIDIGTSRVKVVLASQSGGRWGPQSQVAAVSSGRYRTGSPVGELDPSDVWQTVSRTIRRVTRRLKPGSVVVVGVAGMAEAGCLLAAEDAVPCSPVRLWYDRRGSRQADAMRRRFGPELSGAAGIPITGVRSVAKWRWFVDHGADVRSRWCGVPEWAMLRLTGCWLTEPSLATRTGVFSPQANDYSAELLRLAGAHQGVFPPVFCVGEGARPILPDVADALSLSRRTPVIVAGHDDVVAAVGCGGRIGELVDSSGTAEALIQLCEARPDMHRAVAAGLAVTRAPGGHWAIVGGVGMTGSAIGLVSQQLGMGIAALDRLAARARPFPDRLVQVRLSAVMTPRITIKPGYTRGEIWSSLLDCLAERFRASARSLARVAGAPTATIFTGGGARQAELVRRKAHHVIGPSRVALPNHAAALGSAVTAARSIDAS
jgi:sugar (pentulose or hexulose) kinase